MLKTLAAASAVTLITAMSGPSASWPDPTIVEEPPAQYDYAPTQPFVVIVGSPAQVHHACGGSPINPTVIILACTFMPQRVILMPHCTPDQDAYCGRLFRHEKAHLNGWVH